LVVSPLSGGLSNVLFVVTSSSQHHQHHHQVLVRIQQDTTTAAQDALVNVEEENLVMAWLSQQGKAPTYYGRFENGRVEEFYSDYTPLSSAEMLLYQTQIASLLASIHAMVPPESVLPRRNPNDGKGQCWSTIQKWLDIYKSQTTQEEEEEPLDECLDVDYLQRELQWLQGQLTTTTSASTIKETLLNDATTTTTNNNAAIQYCRQVVFCHMDAQSLNLLRNDKKNIKNNDNIKLIDYEYASWNPRAADIAHTWCEYCDMNNLQANYQQEYPSEQAQAEFLEQYLKHIMAGDDFDKDDDYPIMLLEVNRHALISHLMWTVWSLVQSKVSDIEFDYLQYAKQRMEGYHYFKQRYFGKRK